MIPDWQSWDVFSSVACIHDCKLQNTAGVHVHCNWSMIQYLMYFVSEWTIYINHSTDSQIWGIMEWDVGRCDRAKKCQQILLTHQIRSSLFPCSVTCIFS